MSVGEIVGSAFFCTAVCAASLGPSQVIGAGMLAYSAGETTFILIRVAYGALRNLGKHGINNRRDYKNYDKNHTYTLADKTYFKNERCKAQGVWIKTITSQRIVSGAFGMLPFVGILFVAFSEWAQEERLDDFFSKSNITTIDRILEDIENPNRA